MKAILTCLFFLSSFFIICSPCANAGQEQVVPDKAILEQTDFSSLRWIGQSRVSTVISPYVLQLKDGTLINLTGLRTPDYDPTTPGPLSATAMEILRDLLGGQDIEYYQTRDRNLGRSNRMGHQLAHVVRKNDQIWAQGLLVRLGLAFVNTAQRNPELAEPLYKLEDIARKEAIGVWATPAGTVYSADKPDTMPLQQFVIVEGIIHSTATRSNRTFLNFGTNWKTDFTVAIAPDNRRAFNHDGLNPLQWQGKIVQVRGWLRDYNGPYLEISHPAQIRLLDDGALAQ